MTHTIAKLILVLASAKFIAVPASGSARLPVWQYDKPACRVVLPSGDEHASRLARATLARYLRHFYNIELPVATDINEPGAYIVLGTPANNPSLGKLVAGGAALTAKDIGSEGFELRTFEKASSRYVIVYGKTPRALKHACQELIFYRIAATTRGADVNWPLDVVMAPEFAYRGIYMLPCWSPQDSIESWQRVLRFNSELTLNRNWFWLDGFPIAGHPGIYTGSPLANAKNVQGLIDLANEEDMKFYIGGGWMTWHQEKAVGKDTKKGIDYYLQYFRTFKNFHGFYLEATGEGSNNTLSAESENWRAESDGLRQLTQTVLGQRPDFEIAVATGRFNSHEYLRRMGELAKLQPKQVYWWWCWGDPIEDKAMQLLPNVLRWHTTYAGEESPAAHGSGKPPGPSERPLSGMVTTYDASMGFGNPWNGFGSKINWEEMIPSPPRRDFDPYTIPYFYREYFFRERNWNLDLTEGEFAARLQRRLFDADAPGDAGQRYVELSQKVLRVHNRKKVSLTELTPLEAWLNSMRRRTWTPRTTDTIARMEEALTHLVSLAGKQ